MATNTNQQKITIKIVPKKTQKQAGWRGNKFRKRGVFIVRKV